MSRAQKKKDKNDISTLQYNSKTHATFFMLKICIFVSLHEPDGESPKFMTIIPLSKILLKETLS